MLLTCILLILQTSQSIPFLAQPEVQEKNARLYENVEIRQTDIIKPDTLYNAGLMKSRGGHLYVLDYQPVPRIVKIDPGNNAIVREYGNGRGRGPGELLNPTDFAISGNGSVWIADNPTSRISVFDQDSRYRKEWVIRHIPYKLAFTRRDDILIHSSVNPTIKLADSLRNILWNSEPLVEKPERWASVISGFVLAESNSAFFISNYAGFMVKYDERGSVSWIRRTINYDENVPVNPIPGDEGRGYQVDRRKLGHAVANGFVRDDQLFVLVQFLEDREADPQQVIDVYSTSDGSYEYSIRLPKSVRAISHLEEDILVGLQSNRVVLWKFK
ncbi:hypothetical protein NC796_21860 [Aliifodinibius sp. S!AR15-10]|uniref:hypothetical protein n=1 Tax=Aliifodinibius sp. S!AR15-10 TaxID=2950437 RepID=UPI002859E5D6|nr:hypothetical protein [Aliifodinibius sp. S!AR15-10]MDR8393814.1 hypothetical protein [Aliifodinibius sp. S!AR15-10]